MNASLKYTLFIFTLLVFSCGNSSSTAEANFDEVAPQTTPPESTIADAELRQESMSGSYNYSPTATERDANDQNNYQEGDQQPPSEGQERQSIAPKIIYTAQVRMQVDSLQASLATIRALVNRSGGYISDQHTANTRYEKSAQLTIRLPTQQLEGSLGELRGLARFVDHERLNSEDVTDQWIDLESRLQTKRDVRDRYIEVLRRRAVKVEDILNAEERIRRITEEIEAQEGRLRYLRNRVSLSTLELNLYETIEYVSAPSELRYSFGNRLSNAFANGWSGVREFFLGLVSIWPLFLILLPLTYWGVRRWRR
ncbi:MAG: DUF4349 domain-containing protein [Bacteroidota bacterium]